MLPKKKRMTKDVFQSVMKTGKFFHSSLFSFRYIPSSETQYSFVVPKGIAKKATTRNKFRRLGYNILNKQDLKPMLGIFLYKKEALKLKKEEIEKDIKAILIRIK